MADYGVAQSYSMTRPRHASIFPEGAETPAGTIVANDPYWSLGGDTTGSTYDAYWEAGIYASGTLPSPTSVASLRVGMNGVSAGKITASPGIVLNPTTEATAPDTLGSMMYDSGTDELKYYDGSWQVVSAGGLSSHALDGAYHTATGLTVGDVLSADSATTFSWKAQSGGGSHDLTGASHTEDATGGAGNVIVADSTTTFSWQQLDYTELANIPSTFTPEAHVLATSGPHTGTLPLADLAVGTQGGIIRRGAADWEEYALGTETYVLKAGATDVAWGTVDWSELTGTQPAPVAHVLASASHTVSGLTAGDILSADSPTTYSWKVNPAATVPLALTDLASYVQGSIMIGGGTDWEALVAGTETYVLKMGATEPSWSTVDWSELSGSQPAPISHDFDVHSGSVDLTDLSPAGAGQGGFIKYGSVDWEILARVVEGKFLRTGAADIAWGDVDYSDLTGSQPAPVAHNFIDTTGHPASGLTGGHFLKALTTTTYGFAAHGLGASDVGAYTTTEVDTAIDTDITTHVGVDNAHHEVFEAGDFTTAFAAEDFNNLATTAHVLASADHTVSGLTAGDILSADTATTYSWKANPAATVPLALTDIASWARGSLIIGGVSDWTALAKGTIDQVLTSDGTDLSWEDATGGGPGTGTQWTIPVWATTTTLGDSPISQNAGGTELYANAALFIGADATSPALKNNADALEFYSGSTPTLHMTLSTAGRLSLPIDGSGGGIAIGSDAFLYRSAANTISTGGSDNFIVSGTFQSAGGNFDIDVSGNITDVTVVAATSDTDEFLVLDVSQVKSRTGAEVLVDIGAMPLNTTMPTYPRWANIVLLNGATLSVTYSGISIIVLPLSDADANFACTIKIPDDWSGTTGNLKINYSVSTTGNTYSGTWTVGSFSAGEVITTPNVLNASTSYDFASQTNTDRFYEKTIPLTSLAAGDLMSIRFISDTSNSTAVYIMDVWLES